jgi:hypothetical protein
MRKTSACTQSYFTKIALMETPRLRNTYYATFEEWTKRRHKMKTRIKTMRGWKKA